MTRLSVFESYSRTDEVLAAQIAADLSEIGLDVWRDQRLSGGQEWWDTILRSIRSADVVVFVVSDNSLESVPCIRELGYAEALGKRVLPVRIDRTTSPKVAPRVLASKEWVDYDSADRSSMLRLMRAVNDLSPAGPLPDPLPEEPDVPLSYTTNLAALVHQVEDLTPADQHSLLFQLRDGLRSKADGEECATLLNRMRGRRELLASVAVEIDRALEDLAKQRTPTSSAAPSETVRERPSGAESPPRDGQSGRDAPPDPSRGTAPPSAQPSPPGGQFVSPPSSWQSAPAPQKSGSAGRTLAIVGSVLGVIAIVVLALVLGRGGSADADSTQANALGDTNQGSDGSTVDDSDGGSAAEPEAEVRDTYGDDPDLDVAWDGCSAGDFAVCDSLYYDSPLNSEYETYGATCGDRTTDRMNGDCTTLPFPYIYGDDADLDVLSDACDQEDWIACDDLYQYSPRGSAYEWYGATCGGLLDDPVEAHCAETYSST
ncbi:MAG TPA: toll/interleukin-1 receptor domain-containing protein [Jiangellaceae bacterium]